MSFPHYKDKHTLRSVTTPKKLLQSMKKEVLKYVPHNVIMSFSRSFTKRVLKETHNEKLKVGLFGDIHIIHSKNNVGFVSGFGIGAPVTVAYMEDLMSLGVKNFIAVGMAGSLDPNRKPGDIVVCSRALRDEGTSYHYAKAADYAKPSLKLVRLIVSQLNKSKVPYVIGGTWTTDALYRETREEIEKYGKAGFVTVEMEASAMYVFARKRQARAASIFVISDIVASGRWKTAFKDKKVLDALLKAFEIAVAALDTGEL